MEKIKILLLAANPDNTARLALDREAKKIQEELDRSPQRDAFEIRLLPACTRDNLQSGLLNFQPHILHFSGHGEQDGLYFDNGNGQAQFIDLEALTRLFGSQQAASVQCVLLNACYTEQQATAFSQHIPYTVGMSKTIGDQAAIDFAAGFYRALFSNQAAQSGKLAVELAFAGGCTKIDLAGLNEWQTPQLLRKPTPQRPFLTHLPADIVLHAAPAQQPWAREFANELRKHLSQELERLNPQLGNQSCAVVLANEIAHPELAAGHLLLVSDADATFPALPADAKRWLIARSGSVPVALNGISQYPFTAARANDYAHSALFQELARVLAQHLQSLKQTEQVRKAEKPFGESLVFIHTEPDEAQSLYAKALKPYFKAHHLACATANLKDYREDVRSNQKICQAVLIVYGGNYRWAKERVVEYQRLQQKRKETLKVIVIHADCTREAEDLEDLNIYDSVPLFCPPRQVEDMVQHFVAGLK